MLYTKLYISNADRAFNNDELEELVSESRTWNSRHGITGFLAYVEGVLDGKIRCQFIQVVEGLKSNIEEVFSNIKHDPRHRDIYVIKEGIINTRQFGSWNMGFERLNLSTNPELQLFFSMDLLMLSVTGDIDNNILMQFMKTFYDQKEQSDKDLENLSTLKHFSFMRNDLSPLGKELIRK
ncbi:MAG: BLUF domain-containing protein [Pedobacter sp.]